MVVDTSSLEPIFLAVILTSSRIASDSPCKSSKNGILCVLAASLANTSNSGLFTTIPLLKNSDNSIVLFITYGLKSSGTITSEIFVIAINIYPLFLKSLLQPQWQALLPVLDFLLKYVPAQSD